MKRHAKKAWNQLKHIGAPVLSPDLGWGGEGAHFAISGEQYGHDNGFYEGHKDYAPDGNRWANAYSDDLEERYSVLGVHREILKRLDANGLYAEWVNAGVLAVYDA